MPVRAAICICWLYGGSIPRCAGILPCQEPACIRQRGTYGQAQQGVHWALGQGGAHDDDGHSPAQQVPATNRTVHVAGSDDNVEVDGCAVLPRRCPQQQEQPGGVRAADTLQPADHGGDHYHCV